MSTLRCLCINLDRSPDRWASIQKQAAVLGLRIDRLPAVDGGSLANPPDFPVSAGAIGCFLSHRACWEDIGRGAADPVLVLEDDALLSPALPDFLNDPSWLPDDADLVHLGAADTRCFVQGLGRAARDRTLYRSVRCTGTEAYIITRRCAAYLARNLTAIDSEFDQILFGGGARSSRSTNSCQVFALRIEHHFGA
ncbi:MAG: glycosyltransferase family 25 protein [Hyphomicrobiaceae bacterium]